MSEPCVLVLAGLDPSGGAGLLADAEAVRAAGARPLCVATALTVQSTRAARRFLPVAPLFVLESARCLLEEEDVRAIKIGMVGTPQLALALSDLLAETDLPVVFDPVLAASRGAGLFRGGPDAARQSLRALWSRATLVTPNALEVQALLGRAAPPVTPDDLQVAGEALLALGARAVLVKGGHLPGGPAEDVLVRAGGAPERFEAPRVDAALRGTGCRLASAVAAHLARERPLSDAVRLAKEWVRHLLEAAAQATGSPTNPAGALD